MNLRESDLLAVPIAVDQPYRYLKPQLPHLYYRSLLWMLVFATGFLGMICHALFA